MGFQTFCKPERTHARPCKYAPTVKCQTTVYECIRYGYIYIYCMYSQMCGAHNITMDNMKYMLRMHMSNIVCKSKFVHDRCGGTRTCCTVTCMRILSCTFDSIYGYGHVFTVCRTGAYISIKTCEC